MSENETYRNWMISDLVEVLASASTTAVSLLASANDTVAELEAEAASYLLRRTATTARGEAYTDEEAWEAARKHAAYEWEAWHGTEA